MKTKKQRRNIVDPANRRMLVLAVGFVLFAIVISSVVLSGEGIIVNSAERVVEGIMEIEVWAKTIIGLEANGEIIRALLLLDNDTAIPEQEIGFYLDESFLESKITDSEGYAEVFFNPYNLSPGTYSFKSTFQGNNSLFFNASSIERRVEVVSQNGAREIRIIESSEGEIIEETYLSLQSNHPTYLPNETIELSGRLIIDGVEVYGGVVLEILFDGKIILSENVEVVSGEYAYSLLADFENPGVYIVNVVAGGLSNQISFSFFALETMLELDGLTCKEFTDNVLFSSGYTHKKKGSTNYETWVPEVNCSGAGGQDCSLRNVNTKSRLVYVDVFDEGFIGEGYAQITELENSDCSSPEKKNYGGFIAYDALTEEGGKWERYCERDKAFGKCKIEDSVRSYKESTCYGIKTYASQYSIVDVVEIKYTWCWGEVQ